MTRGQPSLKRTSGSQQANHLIELFHLRPSRLFQQARDIKRGGQVDESQCSQSKLSAFQGLRTSGIETPRLGVASWGVVLSRTEGSAGRFNHERIQQTMLKQVGNPGQQAQAYQVVEGQWIQVQHWPHKTARLSKALETFPEPPQISKKWKQWARGFSGENLSAQEAIPRGNRCSSFISSIFRMSASFRFSILAKPPRLRPERHRARETSQPTCLATQAPFASEESVA